MLPIRIKENARFLADLPIKVNYFPLEVLALDDNFIKSGALEEINDVRQPEWRSSPGKLSYRGTFQVMGQVGVGTQWGVRNLETPAIWNYLQNYYGLQDGDFYLFSNALPTFAQTLGIKSFGRAMTEVRQAEKAKRVV
jgi:hypothetical protein